MNHFKDNLMQQKSYMNWQVAFCLAVFITLMCIAVIFSLVSQNDGWRDIWLRRHCS